MNTPNKLTIFRIILVPVFMFFLLTDVVPYKFLFSAIVFIIASFTDFLDGNIARKNNQITDFGKLADPIADKILVMSAFICFAELGIISSAVPVIILTREFVVTSMRLVAASKGVVIAANIWGKIKTVSQMLAIIATLVMKFIIEISGNQGLQYILDIVSCILIWLSVLLTIISGIVYIVQNKHIIKTT